MPDWLVVVLIVLGVVLLAAFRAWTWVRKERLMREAGGLLHGRDPDDVSPDTSPTPPDRRTVDPD